MTGVLRSRTDGNADVYKLKIVSFLLDIVRVTLRDVLSCFFIHKRIRSFYLTRSKSVDNFQLLSSADWRIGTLTIFYKQ